MTKMYGMKGGRKKFGKSNKRTMPTGVKRVYKDSEGHVRSLSQMVRLEPGWAVGRIQAGERAIRQLKDLGIKQRD